MKSKFKQLIAAPIVAAIAFVSFSAFTSSSNSISVNYVKTEVGCVGCTEPCITIFPDGTQGISKGYVGPSETEL